MVGGECGEGWRSAGDGLGCGLGLAAWVAGLGWWLGLRETYEVYRGVADAMRD